MRKTRTDRNARRPEKSTTITPSATPATTTGATTRTGATMQTEDAPAPSAPARGEEPRPDVGGDIAHEPTKSASVQIVTRFPADLAALLDRYTERLRNERLGLRVSRADAVRILVHERLVELETAREWPGIVKHEGRTYYRTGKLGTSRATGGAAAEYEDENHARVWRDASGVIRPE